MKRPWETSTTYGETELTADDRDGLKQPDLRTKLELDLAERDEIFQAYRDICQLGFTQNNVFDDVWLRDLHRRMLGNVWVWAGHNRLRLTNIGVPPENISTEIRNVCEDATVWVQYGTFGAREICARFHHRLLKVHPFRDGNGRWARVATTLLAETFGLSIDWELLSQPDGKRRYVEALRQADSEQHDALVELFAEICPPPSSSP